MIQAIYLHGRNQQDPNLNQLNIEAFKKKIEGLKRKKTLNKVAEEFETSGQNNEDSVGALNIQISNSDSKQKTRDLSNKKNQKNSQPIIQRYKSLYQQTQLKSPDFLDISQMQTYRDNGEYKMNGGTNFLKIEHDPNLFYDSQYEFDNQSQENILSSSHHGITLQNLMTTQKVEQTVLRKMTTIQDHKKIITEPEIQLNNMHSLHQLNQQYLNDLKNKHFDPPTLNLFDNLLAAHLVKERGHTNKVKIFKINNLTNTSTTITERLIYQASQGTKDIIKGLIFKKSSTKLSKKVITLNAEQPACQSMIRIVRVEKAKRQDCSFSCSNRYKKLFKISLEQLNKNQTIGFLMNDGPKFKILSIHKKLLYEILVHSDEKVSLRLANQNINIDDIILMNNNKDYTLKYPAYIPWQEKILLLSVVTMVTLGVY
ncbi:UNKNOWN [Stylonychia lemnae]|uniref:Uncharacterized protein n=1 Tax=Stylonychia lemnae TaxID=5949 RepID=A0A078A6V3_STYLE|nr:UNKNOWN [Stylonychia lemnae]|eukprot:CDW76454.1 UNKNOWN [Stylonychia lemnae]